MCAVLVLCHHPRLLPRLRHPQPMLPNQANCAVLVLLHHPQPILLSLSMEAQVRRAVLMPPHRLRLVPCRRHRPLPILLNLSMEAQAVCAVLVLCHHPRLLPRLRHPPPMLLNQANRAVLVPHHRLCLAPCRHHHRPLPILLNLSMEAQAMCAVLVLRHHPSLVLRLRHHPPPILRSARRAVLVFHHHHPQPPPPRLSMKDSARRAVLMLPCHQLMILLSMNTDIQASPPRHLHLVLPNLRRGTRPTAPPS